VKKLTHCTKQQVLLLEQDKLQSLHSLVVEQLQYWLGEGRSGRMQ